MVSVLEYTKGGLTAENIFIGLSSTGYANPTDNHHPVDDGNAAPCWEYAPSMRDHQAAHPGLPRLGRQLGCRYVKGSGGVGFIEGQISRSRFGSVHAPGGDQSAAFVHHGDTDFDTDSAGISVRGIDQLPSLVDGDRLHGGFVFAKERCVDFDGALVLGGNVHIFEDRIHRANYLALLAIDTDFGIDVELKRPGGCVDASDWTNLDAGSIVGAEARDNVRHSFLTWFGITNLKSQFSQPIFAI
jgi:hypothetical protein